MSNFDFILKNELFKPFAEASVEAENSLAVTNVSCAIMCRRALELAVKWLYANDTELTEPYQNNLSSLVYDSNFKGIIDDKVFNEIIYIIKLGNYSVHSNKKVSRDEAVISLKYLFDFMKWISYCYDSNYEEVEFDENKLSLSTEDNLSKDKRIELEEKLFEKDVILEKVLKENEELRKKITEERTSKKDSKNFDIKDISEFETRKKYIDLDLKIAGWEFGKNIEIEYPVKNMTSTQEKGYVDYVLFGEDGKPLAVVEAKRASKDARYGIQQAKLYADCLEREFAQRPVIYYTNGREIYMWDDLEYPERKVAGFYTQKELQLLVNRRKNKESLDYIIVDSNIAGRPYQQEAIRKVCESFEEKHRKALLVMATGTGKTRTAISIVDVLLNKNWIQNILFLADRTELVKQAEKNFSKMLPNLSCCNLLSTKENPEESRMIFSTYQTMMNCIDTSNDKNGNKLFTPGHFDLIIIDEAHRSIYKKYQAIFEYFDGLLVGLTATPRNDVDKNTYRFFELENNVPNFVYEYDEAVKDGYLVDYHVIKTNTKFMDRGIKYSELSEEDKAEYENLFEDGEIPEEISSNAINSWLFNEDTVKKVLEILMEKGLKVDNGDKLGKTIIFARNHKHAVFIKNTFDKLYPIYGGKFADVIDNQVNFSSTLIEQFENINKMPQIAISVDMLDTGIDVPEVLNLVFFKPVKSKIKFWQMIGRGTRLCEDLFGINKNKEHFYIFDCCKNFEFFEENQKGIESKSAESITEKIYNIKLDFIREFESFEYQSQEEFVNYRKELITEFISEIKSLNMESFMVKNKAMFVEKYSNNEVWNHIGEIQYSEIKEDIIPLFISKDSDIDAKRFDNLLYSLQIRRIQNKTITRQIDLISALIEELKKLGTIPQVVAKKDIILKVSSEDYLRRANFFDIEELRKELRELIKFIDNTGGNKSIFIDITDEIFVDDETGTTYTPSGDYASYKKKVAKFFKSNQDNLIIMKIKTNQKLTEFEVKDLERIMFEDLGSNKEYHDAFGNKNVVEVVRNIVGLDKEFANELFAKYINDNRLNTTQIQFVKMLVDYVVKNGTFDYAELNEDPFSSLGESVADIFEGNIKIFREIQADINKININGGKTA